MYFPGTVLRMLRKVRNLEERQCIEFGMGWIRKLYPARECGVNRFSELVDCIHVFKGLRNNRNAQMFLVVNNDGQMSSGNMNFVILNCDANSVSGNGLNFVNDPWMRS